MRKKHGKEYIQVKCAGCGELCVKEFKEYVRQIAARKNGGEEFYCDLKCYRYEGQNASFSLVCRAAQKSAPKRGLEFDLTPEYLKEQWENQNGKCPYSKIDLVLPTNTFAKNPRKASLDRIDNSKGYIRGNVEFVSLFVNLGKGCYSKNEILSIFEDHEKIVKNSVNTEEI